MPLDYKKPREGASSSKSDARFNVSSDPRFKFHAKEKTKIQIDDRFSSLVKTKTAFRPGKRDLYGRKLTGNQERKALEELYDVDYDEQSDEPDDDDEVQKELAEANNITHDPARQGGFESSSEEDESESDSDLESEQDAEDEMPAGPSMQRIKDAAADVEQGEVTNRMAIVNLDWDNIKAVDLLAVFSSFVPTGGHIEKVSIFPSAFGRERMQREEMEGPPKELFKKKKKDGKESDHAEDEEKLKEKLIQEGDGRDFDHKALRTYQLDRLRYFYAVIICSDEKAAKSLYDATDGHEYLASSNFVDLRFIPDDTTFDDEPHDECDHIPKNYKPVDFTTDALQHSKVKLTWDINPDEAARKDSINRAFTGGKDALLENDLKTYLASDSDDDDTASVAPGPEDEAPLSKKELARRKMREKLGFTDEAAAKADGKSGPVGNMTVKFGAALVADGDEAEGGEVEETTIEKYKRKEKERKERKRAARGDPENPESRSKALDGNSDVESDVEIVGGDRNGEGEGDDMGFNDPFFTVAQDDDGDIAPDGKKPSKTERRKTDRRQKREAREAEEAQNQAEHAKLSLLLPDDEENGRGFNMKELVKEEKQAGKKGKHKKKDRRGKGKLDKEKKEGEGFEIQVDDRFPDKLGVDKVWAIDPSQPQYTATAATKKFTEGVRRKRREVDEGDGRGDGGDGGNGGRKKKKAKTRRGDDGSELRDLVEKVKRKVGRK